MSGVYHHIGTGNTRSDWWCQICEGYYGVPHDGDTHNHTKRGQFRTDCACAPCQKHFGIYPSHGKFEEHDRYLADWKDNEPSWLT